MSTLPTCAVRAIVRDSEGGEPVAGAKIVATLSGFEVAGGYVAPRRVEATTDVEGIAILNLWPNEQGSTESFYKIVIQANGRAVKTTAVVPNVETVDLHMIAELPPYPGKPDGLVLLTQMAELVTEAQAAVEMGQGALDAAEAALISQTDAAASKAAAAVSAGAATTAAGTASAAAEEAATSAIAANESRILTQAAAAGVVGDVNQQFKVSAAFARVHAEPMRILLSGTSIASFEVSAIQIIAVQLQMIYGRNHTKIQPFGILGGTYGPSEGLQKQAYGGSTYVRAAMQPGNNPISFTENVDGFMLVYGKETDGGTFKVLIDGVEAVTLDSAGAQAYELTWSYAFPKKGVHTITIQPPTVAGKWAYVQRLEMQDFGPGIFIEDATMGGAGLHNVYDEFSSLAAGKKPYQATVGNNGVDSWFGRTGATKPNLIFCQQFTNDGDLGLFQNALNRAAVTTAAGNVPLVLVNEMPALSFVEADGTLNAFRQQMRDVIKSFTMFKHIAAIDWIGMVDFSNKAAYEARYFPTVDKTHPTAEGHTKAVNALANLFSVPMPGADSIPGIQGFSIPLLAEGVNPFATDVFSQRAVAIGSQIQGKNLFGSLMTAVGKAMLMMSSGTLATVFASPTEPNTVPASYVSAIMDSSLSDEFGPYRAEGSSGDILGEVWTVANSAQSDYYTVLMLVRENTTGTFGGTLVNAGDNSVPIFVWNGREFAGTNGKIGTPIPRDRPVFIYQTIKRNAPIETNGFVCHVVLANVKLYGLWAVEGAVPILTPRVDEAGAYGGFPLYHGLTEDPDPREVIPGQIYHTYDPTGAAVVIKKRATNAMVYKPLENRFARLYELLNKGAPGLIFDEIQPDSPNGVLIKNGRAGGKVIQSASVFNHFGNANWWGKRMTLSFRRMTNFLQVLMQNNGSGYRVSLTAAGWVVGNVGFDMGAPFVRGMTSAITFDMPAVGSEMAVLLGNDPLMQANTAFGQGSWSYATLTLGESACI